jgi:hypothetical protein
MKDSTEDSTDGATKGATRSAVLVSLGAAAPGEALLAGVRELQVQGYVVTLVSRTAPTPALATALDGRSAVGRPGGTLQAGKLKLDPHRLPGAASIVLGRSTRDLLRRADLLVALDAPARPAVWLSARLNRGAAAVTGLPAALTRTPRSPN